MTAMQLNKRNVTSVVPPAKWNRKTVSCFVQKSVVMLLCTPMPTNSFGFSLCILCSTNHKHELENQRNSKNAKN
eukprot:3703676-Amphidinium_carterae.1